MPVDLVAPPVARGQQDDRHLAIAAAPLLQDRNAVHFRQADIENDDIVGLGVAEEIAFLAVRRRIDGKSGIRQRRQKLAIKILIILDDERAHG